MLSEIAKLFTGRADERRAQPRKVAKFSLWWRKDEATVVEGVGLEISATGVVFVLKEKPPEKDFSVIFQIGERRLAARITTLRTNPMVQNGATWFYYAAKFTGISADDWDAIVRWVSNAPEPENKGAAEIKDLLAKADDAYRLLPLKVQTQIIDMLVEMHRLLAPPPGTPPLLKMNYLGPTKRANGTEFHRFQVHSRMRGKEEVQDFDTTFVIEADGTVKVAPGTR